MLDLIPGQTAKALYYSATGTLILLGDFLYSQPFYLYSASSCYIK